MGPRISVAVLVAAAAACGWTAPPQDRGFSEEDLQALDRLRKMPDKDYERLKKELARLPSDSGADDSLAARPQDLSGAAVFVVLLLVIVGIGVLLKFAAMQRRDDELYRHRGGRGRVRTSDDGEDQEYRWSVEDRE